MSYRLLCTLNRPKFLNFNFYFYKVARFWRAKAINTKFRILIKTKKYFFPRQLKHISHPHNWHWSPKFQPSQFYSNFLELLICKVSSEKEIDKSQLPSNCVSPVSCLLLASLEPDCRILIWNFSVCQQVNPRHYCFHRLFRSYDTKGAKCFKIHSFGPFSKRLTKRFQFLGASASPFWRQMDRGTRRNSIWADLDSCERIISWVSLAMTANILSFLCLKFYLISTGGIEITEEKKRVGILEESRAFRDRHASKERSFSCERGFSCVTPSILKLSTFFRKIPLNVSIKTWNDLKTPTTTYNHL